MLLVLAVRVLISLLGLVQVHRIMRVLAVAVQQSVERLAVLVLVVSQV